MQRGATFRQEEKNFSSRRRSRIRVIVERGDIIYTGKRYPYRFRIRKRVVREPRDAVARKWQQRLAAFGREGDSRRGAAVRSVVGKNFANEKPLYVKNIEARQGKVVKV